MINEGVGWGEFFSGVGWGGGKGRMGSVGVGVGWGGASSSRK